MIVYNDLVNVSILTLFAAFKLYPQKVGANCFYFAFIIFEVNARRYQMPCIVDESGHCCCAPTIEYAKNVWSRAPCDLQQSKKGKLHGIKTFKENPTQIYSGRSLPHFGKMFIVSGTWAK